MGLEDEFQTELQNARVMGREHLQKVAARHVCCARVQVRAVGSSRTGITVDKSELRVVEHIERFRTKLKIGMFIDSKMLVDRHVEVRAIGIVERVSARIAKRQTYRGTVGIRIIELENARCGRDVCVRISYSIRVGRCACDTVADPRVVQACRGSERRSRAEGDNSRVLPTAQHLVRETWIFEERQVPNIAEVEHMSL